MGRRQLKLHRGSTAPRSGNIDAVILSLLGLLTAFTFSAAYSRYETRRKFIVAEANALGTAWLRIDRLPVKTQPDVRILLHRYVESRARLWAAMSNDETAFRENERGSRQQTLIWKAVMTATDNETHGDARKLLLPALNHMFDIATTRLIAVQSYPPLVIFLMLGLFSLATACLTGHSMAQSEKPQVAHIAGYSGLACLVLIMICDIECPRFGFVRLDVSHLLIQNLVEQIQRELQG